MKKFGTWLRNFFFPGKDAKLWMRLLPYAVLGVLSLTVLVSGAYAWDYTNSPQFCGTACHTMPPEYAAYLGSPHARVSCTECHIGRDFIATQITRKAGDLKHVLFTLTNSYEYPIVASSMRPARETCEKCHNPDKFSDDTLVTLTHFANDTDNTVSSTYLVLKTGGGSKRLGMGKGIHWHVENRVLYYPTDKAEQTIPYVMVVNDDGSISQYVDIQSGVDVGSLKASDLKEMDCITCHNRVTHDVPMPEDQIDKAMTNKLIDTSIPEIRDQAVTALRATYATKDEGLAKIGDLENFYKTNYADYYGKHTQTVENAVAIIKNIYQNSVFPDQKSDWNTHPNNLGHQDSPGCFRCHDGKHFNAQGQAIRLECNLCHSIPAVAGPQDFTKNIEVSRGPEPDSHLTTSWIVIHSQVFDQTCSTCHNTADAGGVSNTSFCSNSACHGSSWKFAGFDAPALRAKVIASLPPTATPAPTPTKAPNAPAGGPPTYQADILPVFQARCVSCHGSSATAGLNLSTYSATMAGGKDGAVIVAGKPDESLLVKKQSGPSPHFGQLSASELQLVVDWITAGAKEK